MSASEFEEWIVIMQKEGLTAEARRVMHGQVVAALHNGPLTRNDGAMWHFDDLVPDPWAAPSSRKESAAADIASQVASINARFDG